MAGRDLPGHDADGRWLVDRQVYERRRDGVRYVSWSRSRQLRLAWLAVVLLVLAAGLGGFSFWAGQRLGPELVSMLPVDMQARIATWVELGQPAATDDRERQLRNALAEALRERDAARAKLAEQSARAEPAVVPSDQGDGPVVAPADQAGTRPGLAADPDLEMTLLRHERDAAREQIDALMQLTTQLKAELGERSAGRDGVVEPVVSMAAVSKLESDLESAREATRKALTERDALQAKLLGAATAAQALQASHDELAGRAAQAELALAGRDDLVEEGRKELEAAQAALAEARDAAEAGARASQAAMQDLRSDLDARTEAAGSLQSEIATLQARLTGLEAQLERTKAERDQAVQADRSGREQLDAMAARLQARNDAPSVGDAERLGPERDRSAAGLAAARIAVEDARSEAEQVGQQLLAARSELAGARSEAEGLRQALASANAELNLKDQALAAVATLQLPLALADAKGTTGAPTAASPEPAVVPAATWTVVEDGNAASRPEAELDAALTRIDELVARLAASEQRSADLERYLGDRAPPPPPIAPR